MKSTKIILNRGLEKELKEKEQYTIEEFIKDDGELCYYCFELDKNESKEKIELLFSAEAEPIFLNTSFCPSIFPDITIEDVQVHPNLFKPHLFMFKKLENLKFKEEYDVRTTSEN